MARRRLLIIGVVSLALGGFVSSLLFHLVKKNLVAQRPAGIDVVIAADDIPMGKRIEDRDLRIVSLASAFLPPDILQEKESVLGVEAVFPIEKGEYVTKSKLGAEGGPRLSRLIPPGMRAASVRVNDLTSIGGLVDPDSRVDVLVTSQDPDRNAMQTMTVLQDIRVLAVDTRTSARETVREGHGTAPSVVTLLVLPEDAQRLALASQAGRIQLVLRNPTDTHDAQVPITRDLYGLSSGSKRPVKARVVPAKLPAASDTYTIQVIHGTQRENVEMRQ
jgi:pilus assembly protein CpaB